jgi:hypothetical protein
MPIAPHPTVTATAEPTSDLLPVVRRQEARRPERPLIFALPLAAWLCFWGAPSAILAR